MAMPHRRRSHCSHAGRCAVVANQPMKAVVYSGYGTTPYEIRRSAQGKTHRDIRRSLKRALARRLYRKIETAARLQNAARTA